MDAYNPKKPDSYAVHLASIDTPRGAVATRDIHNEDGVLLVKKGFAIKAETVQRLLNHKLVQPFEISVNIADAVTAQQLYDDVLAMLRADKECQAIHQTLDLDTLLRQQCERYASLPLIAQKTTVLHSRFRSHYHRALFSAWFSLALAVQLGAQELLDAAFIAGLVHDMGLLHIEPEVVTKTEGHTPEQWRALQSHTLIADAFLAYVEGLPAEVRRAVREHHEHEDGTGYPAALFSEKLCTLGRIVAMTDTVWLTSKHPSGRKVHTLAEVITLVKMNAIQQPEYVLTTLYKLHQRAGFRAPAMLSAEKIGSTVDYLIKTEPQLLNQFRLVERLMSHFSKNQKNLLMRSMHLKMGRLWFIVTSSGLLSESLSQWLYQVSTKSDDVAAVDLHDMSLMYKELQWQLAQLERILRSILTRSTDLNAGERRAIEQVAEALVPGQNANDWSNLRWDAADQVHGGQMAS